SCSGFLSHLRSGGKEVSLLMTRGFASVLTKSIPRETSSPEDKALGRPGYLVKAAIRVGSRWPAQSRLRRNPGGGVCYFSAQIGNVFLVIILYGDTWLLSPRHPRQRLEARDSVKRRQRGTTNRARLIFLVDNPDSLRRDCCWAPFLVFSGKAAMAVS